VSVERVTILGTGRMEAAMVTSLRRAGFEVTVWNRTSSKAETVARETGALTAETAADVVAAADVVMSSLADDDACACRKLDRVHAARSYSWISPPRMSCLDTRLGKSS
jgi:3-hydroxyisobutyrate dehydrogenase-like beta-hydroxyacid dehydrogenase